MKNLLQIVSHLILSISVNCKEDFECGLRYSNYEAPGRIIGGKEAIPGDFPWMIGITESSKLTIYCGGSLLNKYWIMTAAHCMTGTHRHKVKQAIIGGMFDENLDGKGTIHKLVNISVHQLFDEDNPYLHYDIAVSLIEPPAKYSKGVDGIGSVGPICLPRSLSFFSGHATICGWGSVDTGGKKYPSHLQALDINILDDDTCDNYKEAYIEGRNICSGYEEGGKDSCVGDSGGPLVAIMDEKVVQIGILSHGFKCAEPKYPGVYTRVAYFREWINEKTGV